MAISISNILDFLRAKGVRRLASTETNSAKLLKCLPAEAVTQANEKLEAAK